MPIGLDYNRAGSGDLTVLPSTGQPALVPDPVTGLVTLVPGTYMIPFGSDQSFTPSMTALLAMHAKWSSALAATITFETCNFPKQIGAQPSTPNRPAVVDTAVDVDDIENAGTGNWIQENAATAYIGIIGTNNTVTNMTITAGGTNAGGFMAHIGNMGCRRLRAKIVVTVGGTWRSALRGKSAA